jgi:hypothetical protein
MEAFISIGYGNSFFYFEMIFAQPDMGMWFNSFDA